VCGVAHWPKEHFLILPGQKGTEEKNIKDLLKTENHGFWTLSINFFSSDWVCKYTLSKVT